MDRYIDQLFPGDSGRVGKGEDRIEQVLEAVQSEPNPWDISGKFPIPQFDLFCSRCMIEALVVEKKNGNYESNDPYEIDPFKVQISRMMFTEDQSKGAPWRCDFYYKCTNCSFGPSGHHFGIPIPGKMYQYHIDTIGEPTRYEWREIKHEISTNSNSLEGYK